MSRSAKTLPSILDAVGDTPLVELSRFTAGLQGRLLAKLEYLNPGLSKKDRIGLQMIEDAETDGLLTWPDRRRTHQRQHRHRPGDRLRIKGYPFVAVMSKGNSIERARMMSAFGAEVVLVDQLPGSSRARSPAAILTSSRGRLKESHVSGAPSAPTNFGFQAIAVPITFIPLQKSSAKLKGSSTPSATS